MQIKEIRYQKVDIHICKGNWVDCKVDCISLVLLNDETVNLLNVHKWNKKRKINLFFANTIVGECMQPSFYVFYLENGKYFISFCTSHN